jgi:hypothetical protein
MRAPVVATLAIALSGCGLLTPVPTPPPGHCEGTFQPGSPLEWAGTGSLEDFGLEDPNDPIPTGPGRIFVGTAADGVWHQPYPEGADVSRVVCVITQEQGRLVDYGGAVPEGWEPP